MIVMFLVFVIFNLLVFIVWLMKNFFVIVPRGEKSVCDTVSEPTSKPTESSDDSLVGVTKSVPLQALLGNFKEGIKVQVPLEDIEDAFLHVEISAEYRKPDEKDDAIPSEEQSEIIEVSGLVTTDAENEQLQKLSCLDYFQMDKAIKKVVRNQPLDESDAETMQNMRGTDLIIQLQRSIPEKMDIARRYISKVEQ